MGDSRLKINNTALANLYFMSVPVVTDIFCDMDACSLNRKGIYSFLFTEEFIFHHSPEIQNS